MLPKVIIINIPISSLRFDNDYLNQQRPIYQPTYHMLTTTETPYITLDTSQTSTKSFLNSKSNNNQMLVNNQHGVVEQEKQKDNGQSNPFLTTFNVISSILSSVKSHQSHNYNGNQVTTEQTGGVAAVMKKNNGLEQMETVSEYVIDVSKTTEKEEVTDVNGSLIDIVHGTISSDEKEENDVEERNDAEKGNVSKSSFNSFIK